MKKLITYLPWAFRNVLEYRLLMAAEDEQNQMAHTALESLMNNQFLNEMDRLGTERWERILKLYPARTDSLSDRRARIKARLLENQAFTIRYLRQFLSTMFENGKTDATVKDYILTVQIPADTQAREQILREFILRIKPANIAYEQMTVAQPQHTALYIGGTLVPYHQTTNLPPYLPEYAPMQANVNGALCSIVTIKLPPMEVN